MPLKDAEVIMPQTIEGSDRISQFMLEKQANEIELAWDLRDIFNNNESLVGPLRQLASFALDELDALRRASAEGQQVVTAAWQGEVKGPKNKALIKYQTLANIINNVPSLSAEECSDVIRLYGEVVEKGAKKYGKPAQPQGFVPPPPNPLKAYADLDGKKSSMRRGGDPVWKIGRQRDRTAPAAPAHLPPHVHEFISSLKGGISVSTLKETSTVLKVNRVFGLMDAADISGTTTDSIFFIRRYARLFQQQFNQYPGLAGALDDPIYHLLALATLVAGGHHSLLESALSLSLNRHITGVVYKIGLYTSLLPSNSTHAARGVVFNKLRVAENNIRNRLLLAYYDGPQPRGCYLYAKQGKEKDDFMRLAKADTFLLDSFRRFGDPWPKKDTVDTLINILPH
jgi:hypothetical protein